MKKFYTSIFFLLIITNTFAQGTWTQKSSIIGTSGRYRAVSFVVNDKCYVGTGSTGGGISQNLRDFWEYTPATNSWTQKADLTGPKRTNATGASAGSFGYVGLGSDNGTVLTDWWQYSPDSNMWVQKTSFPGMSRYGAGSFTIQDRIYVGGGIDSINSVHSSFYVYEPVTEQWIQRANLPTPVTSMATFTIGGKGYFVGGATNGSVNGSSENAEYDPVTDTWTQRASYGGGLIFSCVGFALSDIGYVATGFAGNLTDIVYRYEPLIDTWSQETSFPAGIRQWGVSCNVDNRAFFGTGNSTGGNLYNDWWEFVPMTTGITKNAITFPAVSIDASSQQILVSDANGTEQFLVYSIDGKVVLSGTLERGNNLLYVNSTGILFVRLNENGVERVTKVVRAE